MKVTRPVLRYHGGKFRLAPKLLGLFPPHRVYTEVFGGGASVLMQKQRCYSEIYKHRYRHEMTDADHVRLAEVLNGLTGMVIISSYPGKLYERLYAGWKQVQWTGGQFCSSNSRAQKRTEVVWLNDACVAGLSQQRLFG